MSMNLGPVSMKEAIMRVIRAGNVPYVKSSPGVGKSQIMAAIAKEFRLKMIDFRLTTADPTDLQGFPAKTAAERMGYLPPEDIPIEGDTIPNGYDGWFLFFDELSQAFPSLQNASYKLFLDKMVGQKKVHPNVVMAAAGNLDTDNANTHRMSSALQSRIISLFLEVSNIDWQKHAIENDFDYRIRAFLKWKPDLLHNFKKLQEKKADTTTYACPRTWEFSSNYLNGRPNELDPIDVAVLVGTVGEGAAIEFQGYSAIYDKLASYEEILDKPRDIVIPTEPSVLHALASLVAHPQHLETLPEIMPFIDRLPVEFQVWALRDAIKKKPALLHHRALEDWKTKYADRLY